MSGLVTIEALQAWSDREARSAELEGVAIFQGKPDSWFEDPHWFCANGHVSGRFLKSEEDGSLCLACHQPVVLGPKIGEARFLPILQSLAGGRS